MEPGKRLKVASDQPTFLPWAGFWNKVLNVDVLIYSVGVMNNYGDYDNRVRLNDAWLTLPLLKATKHALFKDVRYDPEGIAKVVKTLRNHFGKRFQYQDRVLNVIEVMEDYAGPNLLANLNYRLILQTAWEMRHTMTTMVDDIKPHPAQSKTGRLISRIRRHVQGPIDYYMGAGALAYIDVKSMKDNDINVFAQVMSLETKNETGLQLIAQTEDPATAFRAMGSWKEMTV